MSIVLSYGSDYPLNGIITYFESYMFATIPKHISEHTSFDEEMILIDGNRSCSVRSMLQLSGRKKTLTEFNSIAKKCIPSIPKPTGLSCCMIDIIDDDGVYDDNEIDDAYQFIKKHFVEWMTNNDRVAVMTQHFYQGKRCPHVHMLYQRTRGKHDEFQDYLDTKI